MKVTLNFDNFLQTFRLPVPVTVSRVRVLQVSVYNDSLTLSGEPLYISINRFDDSVDLTSQRRYLFSCYPTVTGSWFIATRDLNDWDYDHYPQTIQELTVQLYTKNGYTDTALGANEVSIELELL